MPGRKRDLDANPIYYVYVLFDWLGIPRYVGKGKGDRWATHEIESSSNWLKDEFIEQTWIVLEDIPKIKIRENVSEEEALATEVLYIKAIGRIDLKTGPLTNMTDGGDGASNYIQTADAKYRTGMAKSNWWKETSNLKSTLLRMSEGKKKWWKSLTAEERIAIGRKQSAGRTPEQWKEIVKRINAAQDPVIKKEKLQNLWKSKTPEEQKAIVARMKAGQSPESIRQHAIKMSKSLTPEQHRNKLIKGWNTRRLKAVRKTLVELVYLHICNL